MPYYKPIKKMSFEDRKRTVAGIQRIRKQLQSSKFPTRKASESLIIGTWNIRNFDDDRFNYGPRLQESFYYIAEIMSRFDIIAVQEICENLKPLDYLIKLLGGQYDYILTDVTHRKIGGNDERLGFIYNKNKVRFRGVAGEIVLPEDMLISKHTDKKRQFARTPFGAQFQAGWFKFNFSTVHIYFGSNSEKTEQYKRRVDEIEAVAKYLSEEAETSDHNQILVGDFNIIKKGSKGFNALKKYGFTVIENSKGSNKDQTKFYDQISFRPRKNELKLLQPKREDRVFQFFDSVYRSGDFEEYKPILQRRLTEKMAEAAKELDEATTKKDRKKFANRIRSLASAGKTETSLKKYYDNWRTFQMSDHLPLWVEVGINFSDQYLKYLSTYNPDKG
jgi:exonuclease III